MSKRVLTKHTLALLFLLPFTLLSAQTSVRGSVIDDRTGEPLPGAEVRLAGETVLSDERGNFDLTAGLSGGQILLTVALSGYQDYERDLAYNGGSSIYAGTIRLIASTAADQEVSQELIPTITLSADDFDDDGGGVQNISGVLTASRDVFVSAAAFTFGPARFRIRGYGSEYSGIFLNNLAFNDLEDGRVNWFEWSGLNRVTSNAINSIGLDAVGFGFGRVGGATNIDLRASLQRRQARVSYASSNRAYRHRVMGTFSTGLLDNGWAVSVSGSRRWADEGYIAGTPYDAYSYFLSVDKRIGNHNFNLVALGAPSIRGRSTASTQEVYDLADDVYINPNWGLQNGEVRNARLQETHQPIVLFRHDLELKDRLTWTTTVGYQTGRNGTTALDWYNAPDPRPTYYRRLPSFIDNEQSAAVADLIANDPSVLQIDWARLYDINRRNMASVTDANGIAGNTVSGLRSLYIIEERRNDTERLGFSTNLEWFVNDQLTVSGGLNGMQQRIENFKVVEDLLGGEFYVDIDRFAEFDSSSNSTFIQNDISVPNRILREGDRFGYDYDLDILQASAWAQASFSLPRIDAFVGGELGYTQFWRTGNVANGKFPDSSMGESDKPTFETYGLKAGITYKLDGRNYLLFNGAVQTRAPFARNAFVSPRTRNELVANLGNEEITAIEGGYLLRAPYFKARAIGYWTRFSNRLYNRSFFLDNAIQTDDGTRGGFVNYIMQGIELEHRGLELAVEAKISPALSVQAVAALGSYTYENRPDVSVYLDNEAALQKQSTVYIENFFVAGTPQTAYTVGLNYNSPQYWFLKVNVNYFDDIYIDFFPERRTLEAVSLVEGEPEFDLDALDPDSDLFRDIIEQERVDGAFTVDLFGGKSFKVGDQFIYLYLGVSNLLDNQSFITGGFEQFRFDFEDKDVGRFPNRYFYAFGRTYFANVAFRF